MATSSTPTMSTAESDEEWESVLEGMNKDSGYVAIIVDDVNRVIGHDNLLHGSLISSERRWLRHVGGNVTSCTFETSGTSELNAIIVLY